MMTRAQFYDPARWGTRWRVFTRWHPTGHKGLDIPAAAGTMVPVLRSGVIVADEESKKVGRFITLQVAAGDFDTYCHVVSQGLGGRVAAGTGLAPLAGHDDDHGTQWTGPHLHYARSSTLKGWSSWIHNLNPEQAVLAALQTPEEDDMTLPLFYVATSDSPSKIVKSGETWVRSAPGEPLRRLTNGQATDWRTALGIIDFTSPNLIGKPGGWFDAAFAEDELVHEVNVQAHPWLAGGSGASAGQVADEFAQRLKA